MGFLSLWKKINKINKKGDLIFFFSNRKASDYINHWPGSRMDYKPIIFFSQISSTRHVKPPTQKKAG